MAIPDRAVYDSIGMSTAARMVQVFIMAIDGRLGQEVEWLLLVALGRAIYRALCFLQDFFTRLGQHF